jgi:hypothetical protein
MSSIAASTMTNYRNAFIGIFLFTTLLIILSSIAGIIGLIRKNNSWILGYTITIIVYFLFFTVLIVFLVKFPDLINQ